MMIINPICIKTQRIRGVIVEISVHQEILTKDNILSKYVHIILNIQRIGSVDIGNTLKIKNPLQQ